MVLSRHQIGIPFNRKQKTENRKQKTENRKQKSLLQNERIHALSFRAKGEISCCKERDFSRWSK